MLRARSAAAAWRGFPASNCCPGIQALSLPRTRASSTRYGAIPLGGDYPRCGQKKVYLEPSEPFGWLNDPPGVNRLIGLYWLATLFYDFPGYEDLRGIACEFYDKFYRLRLTNAQLNNMLAPAGIPRPEPPRPVGQPLTPGPRTAPSLPESAPPYSVSVLPGTDAGIARMPNATPSPALPDQADALCTIPGAAGPITGLEGPVPGVSGLPAGPDAPVVPGGRLRQPGAGRATGAPSSPGLPSNPGQ